MPELDEACMFPGSAALGIDWLPASAYFTEMMTVFSNASPMLSDVTD